MASVLSQASGRSANNLRITAAALFLLGKRDEALAVARRSVALEPDFRVDALAEGLTERVGTRPQARHRAVGGAFGFTRSNHSF